MAVPDRRIVRSGKIWTAAGVSAGLDLALQLSAEIAGREAAEVAQLMIEYDPRPPFNSGHPSKATETVREKAAAALARLARNPRDFISVPKILWRQAIDRSRRAMKTRAGRSWPASSGRSTRTVTQSQNAPASPRAVRARF
jgi:transcriptional regulator GlxA family with amidase domain